MSLLDKASLVQIPSGYKEDKLYSVVPDSGAGDFTFSRSSTGTRVNADGLIEEVPWNQLTYSEDFSSWGAWRQGAALPVTVTTNVAESPTGTLTADRIQCDQVSLGSPNRVGVRQDVTFAPLQRFTVSVWAKSASGNDEALQIIGYGGTSVTPGSFTATNEWQKFSRTIEVKPTGAAVSIIIGLFSNQTVTTSDVYLWGAQVVLGETEKPYIKTTDRLNIPRLDYSDGSCASLLLEPQSTNYVADSEGWSNFGTTGTTQYTNQTDINGGNKAMRIVYSLGTVGYNGFNLGGTRNGKASIYIKSNTTDTYNMRMSSNTSAAQNITVTPTWQRISVDAVNWTFMSLDNYDNGVWAAADISTCFWQMETLSYATSYIPTSGSTVTRNADVSETSGLSSLINSQEGVLFLEIKSLGFDTQNRSISIYDGINTNGYLNRVQIGYFGSDQISFLYRTISGNVFLQNINVTQQQTNKFALKYKENDFSAYINGVKVAEQSSGSVAAVGTFTNIATHNGNNASNFFGKCNQIILFNQALTDTELEELTTL